MRNIILCGLPMSGKSTIGRMLASALSWSYIDLDHEIEKLYFQKSKTAISCREIYKKRGELYFRTLEKEALIDLSTYSNTIISLGGGTMMDPSNHALIKAGGQLIYLKEEPETLLSRLFTKGLPAYLDPSEPKESFLKLAASRIPVYEKLAEKTIMVNKRSPDEVLKEFLDGI